MAYQIERISRPPIQCCTDGAQGLSRWPASCRRRYLRNRPSLTKTARDPSFPAKRVIYCRRCTVNAEQRAAAWPPVCAVTCKCGCGTLSTQVRKEGGLGTLVSRSEHRDPR